MIKVEKIESLNNCNNCGKYNIQPFYIRHNPYMQLSNDLLLPENDNDIYDYRLAFFHESYNEETYTKNLSGPAVCINCGDVIECDVDPRSVSCSDCSGEFKCSCCGEYTTTEKYWVDGYPVCEYCYESETTMCAICDEVHLDNDMIGLYVNTPFKSDFNWRYKIYVCQDCYPHSNNFTELFGETILVENRWGDKDRCINVQNITEDNIGLFQLMEETEKYVMKIKDAKSAEEVDKIAEEMGYNSYWWY